MVARLGIAAALAISATAAALAQPSPRERFCSPFSPLVGQDVRTAEAEARRAGFRPVCVAGRTDRSGACDARGRFPNRLRIEHADGLVTTVGCG